MQCFDVPIEILFEVHVAKRWIHDTRITTKFICKSHALVTKHTKNTRFLRINNVSIHCNGVNGLQYTFASTTTVHNENDRRYHRTRHW